MCFLVSMTIVTFAQAQLDYSEMEHWVFHPAKSGTLIDGYNLDIAVIDENLNTDTVYQVENNAMTDTGVDVFFVHPTILSDLWGYTTIENIPLDDQPAALISASILAQAGLLSKYGRFFAPHYRQGSPPTYLSGALDSTQAAVIGTAYADVKASFLHYLENYNDGNKIVLASHSQGAYLTAMLLSDVFDDNLNLQEQLVTAVTAGVINAYAEPSQFEGGWWQNIPLCTAMDQCNCVMTWRSYKETQTIPSPGSSLPCLHPMLEESGQVYRLFNPAEDWLLQDSIYYAAEEQPLRNYLVPKTNQPYGGNVGFVAFDSLYRIRYHREDLLKVGFKIEHTPAQNDQRPNDLLGEEANPLFSFSGYHNKDYHIYLWALMEQIDMKLETCGASTGVNNPMNRQPVRVYPNPSGDRVSVASERSIEGVEVYTTHGDVIRKERPQHKETTISLKELPSGLYFIKVHFTAGGVWTGRLIKQ